MYFNSLQVLRGIAALAVVLYHLGVFEASIGGNPAGPFHYFDVHYSHGAWFFFTLSGFLMAYLVDSGYRRFLPRRLLRIYPTFLLAAVGTIVAKAVIFQTWPDGFPTLQALLLLPFGSGPQYPLGV